MARLTRRTVDAANHKKIITALDAESRRAGMNVGKPDRDAFLWDDDFRDSVSS